MGSLRPKLNTMFSVFGRGKKTQTPNVLNAPRRVSVRAVNVLRTKAVITKRFCERTFPNIFNSWKTHIDQPLLQTASVDVGYGSGVVKEKEFSIRK